LNILTWQIKSHFVKKNCYSERIYSTSCQKLKSQQQELYEKGIEKEGNKRKE
jgi:hypothetical protein